MPNRLAGETSPYLVQHAENPVDWYPWGEEALDRARREDKPILLSVGYSACHWCHVMAHESFEDPAIASIMNELFVNVKVDREERPDIDQIYQTAHAMLTRRSGGWPLTMFLTPDQQPFFGGTYFPRTARHGLPGFGDLLHRVAQAWAERRQAIEDQNRELARALASTLPEPGDRAASPRALVEAARKQLEAGFDRIEGGFNGAPKFPHPVELGFLLSRPGPEGGEARGLALLTLERMALGGLYDQLGGGFCRYSVDATWTIPHFEKMLYDNGQLLGLYADAWRATRRPLFERVARGTAEWMGHEMQAPEGGFYSSLDADSEGEEGKYYVWTPQEVSALLDGAPREVALRHYGLDGPPNFEGHAWHLRVAVPLERVAADLGLSEDEAAAALAPARATLLAVRARRVRPGRDDKVLTSWNALAIAGMARAGAAFGEARWVACARRAADFLRRELWREGRLLATWKDGRARFNAYLDDYAFLVAALLELAQADFRSEDLDWASALADVLLRRFEDRDAGGFFFTSDDHERLVHRAKPSMDNATPSGNGVAAYALQRLGHVLGETRYLDAAARALALFSAANARHPAAHASVLAALEESERAPAVVALRGPPSATGPWRGQLASGFRPRVIVVDCADLAGLPGVLAKPAGAAATAWVCHATACLPPIADQAGLEAVLAEEGRFG